MKKELIFPVASDLREIGAALPKKLQAKAKGGSMKKMNGLSPPGKGTREPQSGHYFLENTSITAVAKAHRLLTTA